ncbi:hypothetical protein J1N35_041140 [Gossypium stocksii]|uniref:H(+)-exporting diphosphatase n=1 Tax=Gossypium stocksii TaxID=47602 RepID=A0A9D3UF98_9ROSI|nr:hypothetical protein J1N35_041140 [Gossypium stocksii]
MFSGSVIGSAALVSLALFGAYVSRTGIKIGDVLTPKAFIGLIVGAVLPYWFSGMTMKSVGSAALKMVKEVHRQFNTIPGLMEGKAKPDYTYCVKISTDASLCQIIPPGALVMLTPLIVGTLFGVETLASVQAAAKGDTKGDPLKDTSSPSCNILIKLMAVEPFVFSLFFAAHGGLLFKFI